MKLEPGHYAIVALKETKGFFASKKPRHLLAKFDSAFGDFFPLTEQYFSKYADGTWDAYSRMTRRAKEKAANEQKEKLGHKTGVIKNLRAYMLEHPEKYPKLSNMKILYVLGQGNSDLDVAIDAAYRSGESDFDKSESAVLDGIR